MKGRSQAPLEYSLSKKADFPFTINPVKSKDHHSISHTHSSHTDSLWAYYTCFHNMSIKLSEFTRLNTHTHTHTPLREVKWSLLSGFCELTDDDMLRTVSKEEAFNKCNPIDGNPPGCPIPGILQARTLEWVAISFSNAWKWSRSFVSNSQRPHGLQPTWLLRPWAFPGKSTGVGCHCLLRQ